MLKKLAESVNDTISYNRIASIMKIIGINITDTGILSLFLVDKDPILLENIVASELYR